MTQIHSRRRVARFVLTAGIATVAGVTGLAGSASAATPTALPTGTILNAGGVGAIANSYIVSLQAGSGAALTRRYGGTVEATYTSAIRGFHATMTRTQALRLAADPAVLSVEQDAVITAAGTQLDPAWGLDRIDQDSLPLSRSYTYRPAAAVTVYVLDTGMRISHSDFGGRATNGYDFVDNDTIANDCNGHGTHVAGTIGGTKYGVAKDVRLVAVRVLDCDSSGSYSGFIKGIDWVTRNAVKPAVANMSLGGPRSSTLDAAVKRSIAAGVTYAVAAGNDNSDACKQSPASTPDAITVAATTSRDARASYSNYGTCVDIFAPGDRVLSDSSKSNTGSTTMSGTSMASPHVAGAAALVLAAHPNYTPKQVRDELVANATADVVTNARTSPSKLLNTAWLNG
jgi:subtilisin family serine protease